MQAFDSAELSGPDDWSGPTLTGIGNAVVKPRWINSAFRWHRNRGGELFMVIDGEVDMHIRKGPDEAVAVVPLGPGQMVLIEDGEEHVAYPKGAARILVVEEADQP